MFEKEVTIETKGNKYSFDYLTCFEKPMGLMLSSFGKRYEQVFLLYLKLFQSYNTRIFGKQDLYIFDFSSMIRWIVEEKLELNMGIETIEPAKIHAIIERQLDNGCPVILTVNLKDLFYSRHYMLEDWPSILLINGYDRERKLYSVLDTTITEYDEGVKEGQEYKPFVLSYEIVENLYASYKQKYGDLAFVSYVQRKDKLRLDLKAYMDCFELFLDDHESQPYKEIDYVNEIIQYIDKDIPVKQHGVDEYTSQIDFVLIRALNYKEVFFRELCKIFSMLGADKAILSQLEETYQKLLKVWSKIKNKSVICYRIKSALDVSKQLEEVIELEGAVKESIRKIKETFDKSQEELEKILISDETIPNLDVDDGSVIQTVVESKKHYAYVEPGDDLQRRLAFLWGDVLGKERIGIKDNFFDCGGHSLSMVRLIALIIKEFNVELPLEMFFKSPTIEAFAQYIRENADSGAYLPIPVIPMSGKYPISAAQRRLFVIDQLNPDSITYNVTIAIEVDAILDISRVKSAFNLLSKRHAILRTYFGMESGVPFQSIKESVELDVEYKEASVNDINTIIEKFVRPFDLTTAPLIRLMLVNLKENKSLIMFDVPHIIIDGVSVGILIREFAEIYKGNSSLPELNIGYMDYVSWQEQLKNSSDILHQEQYWVKRFEGEIPKLNLPLDYPRPKVQNFGGDTVHFTIDRNLKDKIYQMSRDKESTLYMVLFAVFNVLLHKYTGQEDIIVGSPVADRPHVDLHNMVGMFVNMMPIRNFPKSDMAFCDFLEEVKATALDAFKNQDCQFDVLVEKLGVKGGIDSNPLFNVVFALQNIDLGKVDMGGAAAVPYQYKNKVSKFDILFEVLENENGIDVIIEYASALFKKSTIERFGKHFINLLGSMVEKPDAPIYELDVMEADEIKHLVYENNNTDAPFSENLLMHQLFEGQVLSNPEQLAVEFRDTSVTYKELNQQANTIASVLRAKGIKNAAFTGVVIDRSLEMIEAVIAILKAGGAYIPFEPYLPNERIRKIVDDLSIKVIITCSSQMNKIKEIVKGLPHVETVICLDMHMQSLKERSYDMDGKEVVFITGVDSERSDNLEPASTPDDIAYIIFTSGSTGTPKGVVVRHRPAINLIEWVNKSFSVSKRDKLLFISSLSFDLSVYDIFGALGAGASLHLKSHEDIRDSEALANSIIKHGITFWDSAPPALQQLEPLFDRLEDKEKSKLRLVFMSGDWIPVTLPDRIRETFKGAEVISLGGATEATIWSNYYPVGKVEPYWPSIPYGKPIQNARYYILDKKLKPCPIGVSGDLYIGGACLAQGYINEPELTASKFLKSPFVEGENIYKTGDLSRWLDDDNMEFLGRDDQQVKVRGYRIELGEVESVMRKNKDIEEAIVIAKGEKSGEKQLIGYFVSDRKFTVAEMKAVLQKELPDYMIPSLFVQVDAMPLTQNGKLDRKKLLELAAETIDTGIEYVAPESDIGIGIVNIWKQVLGREKIGIYDSFFDIGGSSLSFIEVNCKINSLLNKHIPVLKMFQYPTIHALEQYIKSMDEVEEKEDLINKEEDKMLEESFLTLNKTLELLRNN